MKIGSLLGTARGNLLRVVSDLRDRKVYLKVVADYCEPPFRRLAHIRFLADIEYGCNFCIDPEEWE